MTKKVLAFDLGASGGRAIVVSCDGQSLNSSEIYRFKNEPVTIAGHMYWDFPRLCHEVTEALIACANCGEGDIDSIGIDTWGVDFGLLDKDGDLLGNPVHYRDSRTDTIEALIDREVGLENLYEMSGIQNIWFNTSYQMCALREQKPELLATAKKFLMMPDLIAYYLTGEVCNEFTAAATTQLFDQNSGEYDVKILKALGLPTDIFPRPVMPGTVIGKLLPSIADLCGLRQDIPVIATACHDTTAAATAVPADGDDFIFISSGTWSLMGTVLEKPIKTKEAFEFGLSNEGMPEGKIKFLKNIMGLWIVQECRNLWKRRGTEYSFSELEKMATEAEPFEAFIDVEDDLFANPSDMPEAICEYCRRTNQTPPSTKGGLIRCAYESLAMKYRFAAEKLADITKKKFDAIHIIGGGCHATMLSQMTANATGMKVVAGPSEATSIGNAINQFIGIGVFDSVAQARAVLRKCIDTASYTPEDRALWDLGYERYLKVISR
ncbi:MAG: rhamnulokinase [Clostridia bacterium]|nr:rhamnulokinase [Clostridia bacterium]